MRLYLTLLVLFTISFNVLKADLGIAVLANDETVYLSAFPCIAENFNRAIFRIDGYQNFVDDFINLRNTNFTGEIDACVGLETDQSDVETYCTTIARRLPHTFNGTVWLQPAIKNLTNVEAIVQACQDQNLNMGIYCSIDQWIQNFGYLSVSSPILTALPIWYPSGTNTTDFNDWPYYSFGGWNTAAMKTLSGSEVACNSYNYFSDGYYFVYYE